MRLYFGPIPPTNPCGLFSPLKTPTASFFPFLLLVTLFFYALIFPLAPSLSSPLFPRWRFPPMVLPASFPQLEQIPGRPFFKLPFATVLPFFAHFPFPHYTFHPYQIDLPARLQDYYGTVPPFLGPVFSAFRCTLRFPLSMGVSPHPQAPFSSALFSISLPSPYPPPPLFSGLPQSETVQPRTSSNPPSCSSISSQFCICAFTLCDPDLRLLLPFRIRSRIPFPFCCSCPS